MRFEVNAVMVVVSTGSTFNNILLHHVVMEVVDG